ncbi:hypothetical protein BgAZ_101560 [Babesia gibsoni]|uniref:Uncharacterized protein n=1 Tax=Babesia gibsoni TaxID=33632 RepID=A0AAD8URA9_BABGI|nr:hypothetical protein BgAZ_101560 [Babesia gibsoni]
MRINGRKQGKSGTGFLDNVGVATHKQGLHDLVSYNIDQYERMLYGNWGTDEVSHLEIDPKNLLGNIAKGAGFVLDTVADYTSGPFPTTNNAGRMNPYIEPLHQQMNNIQNPQPLVFQSPDMIHSQNAPLTLNPPAPGMPAAPSVMVPQVVQPQMAAAAGMAMPMQAGAQMPMQPGVAVPMQTQMGAMPLAMQPQDDRGGQVASNVNEILEKVYVSPAVPRSATKGLRYEYIAGCIVIVMVVVFFVVGCIYRIKQRKKKVGKKS